VHLDADLYESTMAGLEFFYPRMPPGAILICHDYLSSEGVNAAFGEFFADKPEPVIELTGYQCLVVKVEPISAA
jgi:O-methyltransferase